MLSATFISSLYPRSNQTKANRTLCTHNKYTNNTLLANGYFVDIKVTTRKYTINLSRACNLVAGASDELFKITSVLIILRLQQLKMKEFFDL